MVTALRMWSAATPTEVRSLWVQSGMSNSLYSGLWKVFEGSELRL
jgi:hypothetical protein